MSSRNMYLVDPAGPRLLLPPAYNNPATAPRGRSRQVTVTADGGSSSVAILHAKTPFSFAWQSLIDSEADLIDSIADGLFGEGPFVLVDPMRRNVLGPDDSTMGMRSLAPISWVASAGTLTRVAAALPQKLTSGALTWSSLTSSAVLSLGSTVNTSRAPVYVPAEAVTASLYVKAASAVGASLQIAAYDTTGTLTGTPLSLAVSVTTAWQRVNLTAVAGYFGTAAFVSPRLVAGGTTALTVAAAQVEYGTVSDWQRGYSSPRVIVTEDPGHSVEQLGYADKTLVLAQC